jgi:hypothetical protein
MWPLLVAVEGGRWCMIRWGVRPGIVMSLELCVRARRSVGLGGEHNAWWIKRPWSPAMEVAATLAAMAVWGTAVVSAVVSGILGTRGIIHNPVQLHLPPPAAQNCAATMRNCKSNLGEEDLAPWCIAECHHTNK